MLTTTATTTATPATTRSRSSSSDPAREIKLSNVAALEAALEQVQRRAQVRTIGVEDIEKTAARIEANLSRLLPKTYWPGLQFQVDRHARVHAIHARQDQKRLECQGVGEAALQWSDPEDFRYRPRPLPGAAAGARPEVLQSLENCSLPS